MAKLWEISVVTAIRDLQWMNRKSGNAVPEAAFNLAGNAEARLGDLATLMNDRFFIFEIKSLQSDFPSEWKKKKRGKSQTVRTKLAYSNLVEIVKKACGTGAEGKAESRNLLRMSALSHHFAYWENEPLNGEHETIYFQPYLLAVVKGSFSPVKYRTEIKKAYTLSERQPKNNSSNINEVQVKPCTSASLSTIYRNMMGILYKDGEQTKWSQLGLKATKFRDYLNFLCSDSPTGDEKVNLIVTSTGGFLRIATRTSDLAEIALLISTVLGKNHDEIEAPPKQKDQIKFLGRPTDAIIELDDIIESLPIAKFSPYNFVK